MSKTIKYSERYKEFQRKEAEERKIWLESRGFTPILSFNPYWAFPYILVWYVDAGKKIKQIGNLIIRYTEKCQYSVWTLGERLLEDGMTLKQAEEFCRNINTL